MGDIILNYIAHEQRSEIDAYDGIYQIEPVGPRTTEVTGQHIHNLIDDPVEYESCYRGEEADNQCEDDHEHLLTDMLHPQLMQSLEP